MAPTNDQAGRDDPQQSPCGEGLTHPDTGPAGTPGGTIHDARAMCGAEGMARIELDGKLYTLRITRMGRLILTK